MAAVVILTFLTCWLSWNVYVQANLYRELTTNELDYATYLKIGVISDLHLDGEQNSTGCPHMGYRGEITWHSHYNSTVYGARGCDSSYGLVRHSIKSFYDKMLELGDTQFLVNIGDFSSHAEVSYEGTMESVKNITVLFAGEGTMLVPVYSVLGNNDMPVDYQEPELHRKFYREVWEQYRLLMRGRETRAARESFERGGYYHINHAPNLDVIGLNTVAFSHKSNISREEVEAQFEWLEGALEQARERGRGVILLGHISPSVSQFQTEQVQWFREVMWREEHTARFVEIIDRYVDVLRISLFSHSHSFSWYVDVTKPVPPSYFVLSAISPLYENEPSFHVLTVSPTWSLLDIWTYYTPLEFYTRQNLTPHFRFLFSLKEKFFDRPIENKDTVLSGSVLKAVTSKLIRPFDMQRTFNTFTELGYQLAYLPAMISPYKMYCILTQVSLTGIEDCLLSFGYSSIFPPNNGTDSTP